jgi:hypothetical protein
LNTKRRALDQIERQLKKTSDEKRNVGRGKIGEEKMNSGTDKDEMDNDGIRGKHISIGR